MNATQCKSFSQAYCELETYALVHFSLQKVAVFVYCRVFVIKLLYDLHRVNELKNFAANIFLKLVSKPRTGIRALNWFVTYWEPCIERRDCHYRISPIGYWVLG